MNKILIKTFIITFIFLNNCIAEIIKDIKISGNERITSETIKIFTTVNINDDINENKVNYILKELYGTGFFKNVNVVFENNILKIDVVENPIIQEIKYEGIKAQKIRNAILKDLKLKSRSSFNEIFLNQDKNSITSSLRSLGYYFSKIDIIINDLDENKIEITYNIDMVKKLRLKRSLLLAIKFIR